jgi:hypothetical protein
MSGHKSRRAQRDSVEQMLNEVAGTTPAETDALLALFSTAAGPAQPGELAGEAAAVAAFRAAHHPPVLAVRREPTMKRSIARLLTVKAAAAAVVVTSMGGVALAASTGVIPTPLTHDTHKAEKVQQKVAAAAAKAAEHATKDSAKDATEAVKAAAKAAAAADRAADKAGRDHAASFSGLCNAFTAGAKENGKALDSVAFTRLSTAAGDASVTAFCAALAAAEVPPAADDSTGHDAADDNGASGEDHGKSGAEHGKSGAEHGKSVKDGADDNSGPGKSGKGSSDKAGDKAGDKASEVTDDSGPDDSGHDDSPGDGSDHGNSGRGGNSGHGSDGAGSDDNS